MVKITISGWRFAGMNEFIAANRKRNGSWSGGNVMKARDQAFIAAQLPRWRTSKPVFLEYRYYAPNKRKDKDNISGYFHKVFQDALVARGVVKNDGWNDIAGFSDAFFIDSRNPRVEVTLTEVPYKRHQIEVRIREVAP